jgi:hypothetical protein
VASKLDDGVTSRTLFGAPDIDDATAENGLLS